MEPWLVIILVVAFGALASVAQRAGWIDLSNKAKRPGSYGGAMGAIDEVFSPSRYESQIERDRQTILPAPAPLPGDSDKGVYGGRVKIDLS